MVAWVYRDLPEQLSCWYSYPRSRLTRAVVPSVFRDLLEQLSLWYLGFIETYQSSYPHAIERLTGAVIPTVAWVYSYPHSSSHLYRLTGAVIPTVAWVYIETYRSSYPHGTLGL